MLNQVPLQPQVRNPRALLKINGNVIRKIDSIEYIENNYYQPDTFHIELPLYDLEDGFNIEYWLSQNAIMCEIFIGFPKDPINYGVGDLQSLITGGVNDVRVRVFDNGAGILEFDGFDLSKKFIDNKTTEKFPNYTASEVITKLAHDQGLNPIVVPTKTKVGYYYDQDTIQLGSEIPEWDLMTFLAQQEGFQVFVRGLNVYFQPRVINSSNPYLMQANTLGNGQFSFNGTRLIVSRNLNYARDVIVTVKSSNSNSGDVTATARSTPNKRTVLAAAAQPIGEAQRFDYDIPGLTKEQALVRAQKILADISLHERNIEIDGPADNLMRKDSVIQLQGVSESADQIYYPDTITRRISPTEGYMWSIRAKNHSPQSVIVI